MNDSGALERFRGRALRRERWVIAGTLFDLAWPADMDALLDAPETQRRHDLDGYMPYWAQPWPSSVLLAEAVLAGEPGRGRAAIELGCGVGLTSLAALHMGWEVTASDYDEDALTFASRNARANGFRLAAVKVIDYRQPLPEPRYDCVLASDLLYEKRCCEPVARWIASALRLEGFALLSDPNRTAAESFVEHATAVGLQLEMTPVETTAPAGLLHRGRIWRATRPR